MQTKVFKFVPTKNHVGQTDEFPQYQRENPLFGYRRFASFFRSDGLRALYQWVAEIKKPIKELNRFFHYST